MEKRKKISLMKEEEFNEKIYGDQGLVILFLYLEGDKHSVEGVEVMERLLGEYEDKLNIYKLNGEKSPMLVKGFMVRALPTLILFSNGILMDIKTGVGKYEAVERFIRRTCLI